MKTSYKFFIFLMSILSVFFIVTCTQNDDVSDGENNNSSSSSTTVTTDAGNITSDLIFSAITPIKGATSVAVNSNITITYSSASGATFDTAIKPTITLGNIAFTSSEITIGSTTITIDPSSDLQSGTTYAHVSIDGLKDNKGHSVNIHTDSSYEFTTLAQTSDLEFKSITPVSGTSLLPIDQLITVTYGNKSGVSTSFELDTSSTPTLIIGDRIFDKNNSSILVTNFTVALKPKPGYYFDFDTTYDGVSVTGLKDTDAKDPTYSDATYGITTEAGTITIVGTEDKLGKMRIETKNPNINSNPKFNTADCVDYSNNWGTGALQEFSPLVSDFFPIKVTVKRTITRKYSGASTGRDLTADINQYLSLDVPEALNRTYTDYKTNGAGSMFNSNNFNILSGEKTGSTVFGPGFPTVWIDGEPPLGYSVVIGGDSDGDGIADTVPGIISTWPIVDSPMEQSTFITTYTKFQMQFIDNGTNLALNCLN